MTPSAEFVSAQRSGQVQRFAAHLDGEHPATLLAGYRRHTEFDAGDNLGQDWCGVRALGTVCVMVVADGVSQSFMGDIAARVVGRGLLDGVAREGEAALTAPRCEAMLDALRADADREVAAFVYSDAIPLFLRGALEARRTTSGTQTVVAAAYVDLATGRGRLLLVGDVSVVVHRRSGPPVTLAGDRRARWSNLHGLRGTVVNEAIEDVRAVVLATDGVPEEFVRALSALTDGARANEAIAAGAQRDDASFAAVFAERVDGAASVGTPIGHAVPATVEGAPPQAPYLAPPMPTTRPTPAHAAQAYAAQRPFAPQAPAPAPAPHPGDGTVPGRAWKVVLGVVLVLAGLGIAAAEFALSNAPTATENGSMRVAQRASAQTVEVKGPVTAHPRAPTTPVARAPVVIARPAVHAPALDASPAGRDGAVDAAQEVSAETTSARRRSHGSKAPSHHEHHTD